MKSKFVEGSTIPRDCVKILEQIYRSTKKGNVEGGIICLKEEGEWRIYRIGSFCGDVPKTLEAVARIESTLLSP